MSSGSSLGFQYIDFNVPKVKNNTKRWSLKNFFSRKQEIQKHPHTPNTLDYFLDRIDDQWSRQINSGALTLTASFSEIPNEEMLNAVRKHLELYLHEHNLDYNKQDLVVHYNNARVKVNY